MSWKKILYLSFVSLLFLLNAAMAQESASDDEDAASAESGIYDVYTVQAGDSLLSIAEQFNTTEQLLKSLNEIDDESQISDGNSLLVPVGSVPFVNVYEIQPDDTLFSISKRFNSTIETLKSLNAIADETQIVAGESILVPTIDEALVEIHIVASGDSLFSISKRYATTVPILRSLNGIADARRLDEGDTIVVPKLDETVYEVYEILEGDTLFDMSRLFNTNTAQLRRLNGIAENADLPVGLVIIGPKVDESILEKYIVQPGDSLYDISRSSGNSLTVLQALNKLADARDIKVGETLLLPKLEDAVLDVYVFGLDDTLEKIAEIFETTVELLQSLNGIIDPSLIQIGETLFVPTPLDT